MNDRAPTAYLDRAPRLVQFSADTRPARQEDLRLVTGTGKYAADWSYPGMLHAWMIRSVLAHGHLRCVDLSAVKAAPGVHAVLCARDVEEAGFGPLPNAVTHKARDGTPQKQVLMPVLAKDRVHFAGQPIAMVIADTPYQAQDAAALARIEVDELAVVAGVGAARAVGAPQLHEGVPGNLSLRYEAGDDEAVERAFASARYCSTLKVTSQRLIPSPMEPRAAVALHDASTGRTRIHVPNQGMLSMRAYLSAVTRWPAETIEVVAQDVGGSFGIRSSASSEYALVMLAARRLGKPVRWLGSRSDNFLSDFHGRALSLEGSLALDKDGRFLAMRFRDEADLGAFSCYFSTHIGTRNLSVTMGGVYRIAALAMRSDLVFTNTVPVSAYRGAGRPDIAYAIERLVDFAAHEHGFDPIALRRRNFVAAHQFPYTTANGTVYDSGDFHRLLDEALARADIEGFATRRLDSQQRGQLRGFGVACYLEASGPGGAPKDQVEGAFDSQGMLSVYAVTGASGQGHETSFAQVIAHELGWPASRVRYRAGDPAHHLIGNGTGGSRTLYGAGSAVKAMCDVLLAKLTPRAAAQLGVTEDRLVFSDGAWTLLPQGGAGSGPGQTLDAMPPRAAPSVLGSLRLEALIDALIAQGRAAELSVVGEAVSGATFPNGCHIAEVEIDPQTGEARLCNYVSVDDLGKVVSPQLVQGQVHGGVVQGWGQAFCEHAIYDLGSAQLLTGSYMDYPMPRAGCVMRINTHTVDVPTSLNLLGAKGVGESGCSGSLPALANAVINALRARGIAALDMPFTAARIWAVLQEVEGKFA
jgi:carbon-monoxide dehydrogenase large subunit